MPRRHGEGGERGHADEHAIHGAGAPARVMQRCDQEQQAGDGNPDALEDAQRARLQVQLELRIQRVGEQRRTQEEPDEIGQAGV
jgi:hypothetical protein